MIVKRYGIQVFTEVKSEMITYLGLVTGLRSHREHWTMLVGGIRVEVCKSKSNEVKRTIVSPITTMSDMWMDSMF